MLADQIRVGARGAIDEIGDIIYVFLVLSLGFGDSFSIFFEFVEASFTGEVFDDVEVMVRLEETC